MIIGLIGPVSQDIELATELLTEDKEVQVIDSIQLLRLAGRKLIGSLTTQDYHKKYVLKKFEDIFGTVIVTGNLILSEDICEWLLQEGGIIVVVSRDKLESYDEEVIKTTEKYWDEKATQKYNLEVRFKKVYERLQKSNTGTDNLYLVDLGSEDTSMLESLIESSQDWMESETTENSYEELISLIEVRKDDEDMTMEESIKKAMRELGMDVDDSDVPAEPKPVTKKPETKKASKPVKTEVKQQPKDDFMNQPEDNTESEEEAVVDSVFVKLTDTTMALLIPVGLEMEKQNIGGMEFNVATVGIPDLKNRKLQELQINKTQQETEKVSKPERKPVKAEKSEPKKTEKPKQKLEKPMKVMVESGNLDELREEKARLDAEIKKFRAAGDIDTVNSLRKQRRAVRNKINSLK